MAYITVNSSGQAIVDAVNEKLDVAGMNATLGASGGSAAVGFIQAGTGAVARTVQSKQRESVSVKDYGATGSGLETTAFVNAVNAAVASGVSSIFIPFQSFTVGANTNCQELRIIGARTTLTGSLINHAGLDGIIVAGINQSAMTIAPLVPHDYSHKAFYRHAANVVYGFVLRGRTSGLIHRLVNNETTPTNSLATGSGNTTHYRITNVLSCNGIYTYQQTPIATSGTWGQFPMPGTDGGITGFTSSGNLNTYLCGELNCYREYQITPKNGRFNVALRCVSGAADVVEVMVDGVVARNISSDAAPNTIRVFWFYGYDDNKQITVRVTNKSQPKNLRIIGLNFQHLADYDGSSADTLGWSRTTAEAEYITSSGASDSVFLDKTTGIYGGSYHGGESLITDEFLVDGVAVTLPSAGNFSVGVDLQLKSTYRVSGWASGSIIDCVTYFKPIYSGFAVFGSVKGNASSVVEQFYTCMAAWNTSFTKLEAPVQIDLSTLPNQTFSNLGRTSMVKLTNPTTKQSVESHFGLEPYDENNYGGAFLWNVSGAYNKVYYGPVINGSRLLGNRGFSAVHIMC